MGKGQAMSRRRFVGVLGSGVAGVAGVAVSGCSDQTSTPAARNEDFAFSPGNGTSNSTAGTDADSSATTSPSPTPNTPRPLYIGTYTTPADGGKGISIATYHPSTGQITPVDTVTGVPDPSFLALHPAGHTLYAVNEQEQGAVTAVRLADRAVLGSRKTGGSHPCHLSVHPSGRWLLSADYGSGSVAVYPIDASGALGERTDTVVHSSPAPGPGQQGPHAHQFVSAPDGRYVLAVDLGTDCVYTYRLDGAGKLTEVSRAQTRAGAGPRQLTFHPGGRYAYLANEVDDTVAVCAYDAGSGRLTIGEPQSTGAREDPNYPAQLAVTPDGAHAFLANRGDNTLARYAIEGAGARLRLLGTVSVEGDFPRQISLSPDGRLLFASNQRSGTVTVFHVDAASGQLRSAGEPFASPMAVCTVPG